MRRFAILTLVAAACSGKSASAKYQPTVAQLQKRIGIACEARYEIFMCGQVSDPVSGTIFADNADDPLSKPVTRFDLKLEAATGEAAFAKLQPMLDGIVPAQQLDGIKTRFSGPGRERYDKSKPITIDKVEVTSGTWSTVEGMSPSFSVQVVYW